VDDLPKEYLLWVLENCKPIRPTLRQAIVRKLGLGKPSGSASLAAWENLLETWYHDLCDYYEPVPGGSDSAIQVLTDAYERLRKLIQLSRK